VPQTLREDRDRDTDQDTDGEGCDALDRARWIELFDVNAGIPIASHGD